MNVANYTEEVVTRRILELVGENKSGCRCKKCISDMIALTLNDMKPLYYTSEVGGIHMEIQGMDHDFKLDLITKCLKSMERVGNAPRHA